MPGFDGTGPRGSGPMTGGGRGYCVTPLSGMRPRLGRGGGRGRGRRNMFYATGAPGRAGPGYNYPAFDMGDAQAPSASDETQMLKEEAELLKKELAAIQKRLSSLEKSQDTKVEE